MANVVCVNEECPEHELPKGNPGGYPVQVIACGGCGGPVEETDDEPATEQVEEAS